MRCLLLAALLVACSPEASSPDDTDSPALQPVDDGARIREIAFFQAVEVLVARDGEAVAERNAPLIAGRDAILRVMLTTPEMWTPTEMALEVEITDGGASQVFRQSARVLQSSEDGIPTSGVMVPIPAAAMTPDATWRARLVAGAELHDQFPADEAAPLAALETGGLKVRFVPYEVNGFTPDTSEAVIDGMAAALMAAFPITGVETSVADVQRWERPFDLGDINVDVGILQEEDMIAGRVSWDTYYYALASGVGSREAYEGITGTSEAGGEPPLVRAYFAAGAAFGDAKSEETLMHEMGHLHGLLHTACSGEDFVDPEYPHPEASIGVEGYDRRTGTFYPPNTRDLMSYCSPRWISDYGFRKAAEHVVRARSYEGFPP
jgi:hypothetical protein